MEEDNHVGVSLRVFEDNKYLWSYNGGY